MSDCINSIKNFEIALDKANIEVIHIFNQRNYGPFDYLNEINPHDKQEHLKFKNRFLDGLYAIATPKEKSLNFFHLSKYKRPLCLDRPFRFLIGRTRVTKDRINFLAYIPKPYLNHLAKAQTFDELVRQVELSFASQAHNDFFESFYKKLYFLSQNYLHNLFANTDLKELALNGNRRFNVPEQVIEAIRMNKITFKGNYFPIGNFDAHVEQIELPNGQIKTVTLRITSLTRNFNEQNFYKNEKINNYSISLNLLVD